MAARLAGNLPAEMTNFIGRDHELAQVRKLLSAGRLTTLTGPGGVGKSRLARRAAADAARAFADGVWLVELAELSDGALLPVEVARVLGLNDSSGHPVARLAEFLRDKNILLLIDNCEHMVPPVVALVSKLLAAAPDLRVLATSRQVLGSEGEHIFTVPPLSLPSAETARCLDTARTDSEAVELFLDRAAAVVPELTMGPDHLRSVVELCRGLEGLPLAIELAAARLRAYSIEEVLARLEQALDVLSAGRRSGPRRHHALKATIEWSFELCSPPEQLLWARLSVFAGGFDLRAAETVCADEGLPRSKIFDLVAGLVDKSILRRESQPAGRRARFRMLETVREYGREQLAASDELNAVRHRHMRYFAELAERGRVDFFSPREYEWFRAIRADHANLRVALQACLEDNGTAGLALRVASSLRMYWSSPGLVTEGHQWLCKALEVDSEPSEDRAEALWVCAYLELMLADVDRASQTMTECQDLADRFSLRRVGAELALCPILADFLRGDAAAALVHAEQAAVCGREAGIPAITGEALFFATTMAFALEHPRAEQLGAEALIFLDREGAQLWRAAALWINGLLQCRNGHSEGAVTYLTDSLQIFHQLHYELGIALCFDGLAWAAVLSAEYGRASQLLGAARAIWQAGPLQMPSQWDRHAVQDKVEESVRETIGDAAFDRAIQRAMDQPLDLAVGQVVGFSRSLPDAGRGAATQDLCEVLTKRERRVAELLAQGLSNRDIAADLVLSPRTVESHVRHILAKLGFRSRSQIASWISRHEPRD